MKIINVAVIAHVDAGKSTLIDAMLAQGGVFDEREQVVEQVMDSNDLERERGITIYSKNASIHYKDYKINIVDTPGHADFSSEVERIIKTVDTVILLVDASEGPMPQTRYVLRKSLEAGLRPILLINKFDKKDQRAEEVVDESFDLFDELGATDHQLDFPILYGVAKHGIVRYDINDENEDIIPLFETLIDHVELYSAPSDDLLMQISSLAYDDYIGRIGIGRLLSGTIHPRDMITLARPGSSEQLRIGNVFLYDGLKRVAVEEAGPGDIILVSGISHISIGDTIGPKAGVEPLPAIAIEAPTLSMDFFVNSSPFAGQDGKFLTTRHIKERLERELETNVGLRVEPITGTDGYKVSGRGELHLSILIENMRREGYELSVSKPRVLLTRGEHGERLEPFERVHMEAPDEYIGTLIAKMNQRKGLMEAMNSEGGYTTVEYMAPTRSLLGFRAEVINDTRGEGIFLRSFDHYGAYAGDLESERNGVLISSETGTAMAYSLWNLSDRGTLFVESGQEVYEGMIIGLASRKEDIVVNPTKNKKLTNTRSSSADDALKVPAPKIFSLEEALTFVEDDEYVEVTPKIIRLRKKLLQEIDRIRERRKSYT